jgi:acyl carrier protein
MDEVGLGRIEHSLGDMICTSLAQACKRARREVSLETQMLDLDVDSLTLVSVLAEVEAVYGIELTPDDTLTMIEADVVSDLVERLSSIIARTRGT